MKFIADNTSIPVPKIFCSFVHKNCAYIVMERVHGDEIPTAWSKLSEDARQSIFDQLKSMLKELRELKPPPGAGIESCTSGSLRDPRIPRSSPRFGPFKTTQDFHVWLRDNYQPSKVQHEDDDSDQREILEMIHKQDGPWQSPVFTHADLNPFNILIRGEKIAAIIDWETSGWYPAYWEYTSAKLGSVTAKEWQDSIDKFLDPFPQELKMEATRHKWWGEI